MSVTDNAVKFIDSMCEDGVPFSHVRKQVGEFVAVLFYLRCFEKWLESKNDKELSALKDENKQLKRYVHFPEEANCDSTNYDEHSTHDDKCYVSTLRKDFKEGVRE